MKRILSLVLAFAMIFTLSVEAFAAEEIPAIFPEEERIAALQGTADRTITKSEAHDMLDAYTTQTQKNQEPITAQDLISSITTEEFISDFVKAVDMPCLRFEMGKLLYPAKDSIWMSAEEFDRLADRLKEPMLLGDAAVLLDRTTRTREILNNAYIPDDFEEFVSVVDAILPEFSELLAADKSAAEFWVGNALKPNFYYRGSFGSVLHELHHEQSMKKSNNFSKHVYYGGEGVWGAIETKDRPASWFYNLKTGEWIQTKTITLPETKKMLSSAPDTVKEQSTFQSYAGKDASVASNRFGMFGLLQEAISYAVSLRVEGVEASFDYHYKKVPESTRANCYFFMGAMLHYMEELEKQQPDTYQSLLADEGVVRLIVDTIDYMNEQMTLMEFSALNDPANVQVRKWAKDKEATNQLGVLRAKLMEYDAKDDENPKVIIIK